MTLIGRKNDTSVTKRKCVQLKKTYLNNSNFKLYMKMYYVFFFFEFYFIISLL